MSSIWFNPSLQLSDINIGLPYTMGTHLGMEFTLLGHNFLEMKMPVDERTKQPAGLLHGGASCALAETVGSVASYLVIDPLKYNAVGLEINANHIRSASKGWVKARCEPLHIGRSTHVWDIKITDDREKLVCICRLTVAIIKAVG